MKNALAKIGLLLLSLGVALAVGEIVLRGLGYEYQPLQISAANGSDARDYHLFSDDNFVYDPQLIWRPKRGHGVFNSLGFRGPEVGPRNGKIRIATIGDSNTLGWADADGANWPADLAELLTTADIDAEVINAGVWGYSSHQGVPRTREVLELDPDIVLISFGSNDAHQVLRSDAEFSARSLGSRRLELVVQRLRVAQLVTAALDRMNPAGFEPRQRVSQDEYRRNLKTMIDEVRQAGATPVLLTRPFYGPVLDASGWKSRGPEYNLLTTRVAEEQGVLVIDLYSFFKEMDPLFADESHFTDAGHRWAAALVLEHLRPSLAVL